MRRPGGKLGTKILTAGVLGQSRCHESSSRCLSQADAGFMTAMQALVEDVADAPLQQIRRRAKSAGSSSRLFSRANKKFRLLAADGGRRM
jgi:hypothetical protein